MSSGAPQRSQALAPTRLCEWHQRHSTRSPTSVTGTSASDQQGTFEPGPEAAVKGVVEDAKGKLKEAVGSLTGDDSTKQEGQAQQEKAAAEREVAVHEAEAEKSRAKAEAADAVERSHQG